MDFVLLPNKEVIAKPGKLFIEAQIRDDVRNNLPEVRNAAELKALLETHFSSGNFTFELLEDILVNERTADLRLGAHLQRVKNVLKSLKVVEYLGPHTEQTIYSSTGVRIEVQVYELHDTPKPLEEDSHIPQAEITPMPHARFDGIWDELVFAEDIKGDLIWMMTNILRFSSSSSGKVGGDMNPVILLHGFPGTGKTTLCQGLAQKIAIRLRSKYDTTVLVQINTATLLSKYYSESAKQVDEIFTKIARMCQEEPHTFTCVLIDEVESIASSREFSTIGGESHDSLRATNALLTGLDKTKNYPNLIFLCTSNMLDALDDAFLDRCGLKRAVTMPSIASQYEILRKRIQKLVDRRVIQTEKVLPSYEDAKSCVYLDSAGVGARLLGIVELINSSPTISGRSLTQLPECAVLQYLREEECNMDMALAFIERQVKLIRSSQQEKHEATNDSKTELWGTEIEIRGKKRTFKMSFDEDLDIESE
ncbi:hypothetical protein EG329_011489 [Mollisiaceae sp. DMI_Dod_QoI]|nr:hypothetical protein EG329_011489 [Helotiales sp. DMI_Dod_QoI]